MRDYCLAILSLILLLRAPGIALGSNQYAHDPMCPDHVYDDEWESGSESDEATTTTTNRPMSTTPDPYHAPSRPKLHCDGEIIADIAIIRRKLDQWNRTFTVWNGYEGLASWKWETNITDENAAARDKISTDLAEKTKQTWREVSCFDCEAAGCTAEEDRRLDYYRTIGGAALPPSSFTDALFVSHVMANIYSTATVCNHNKSKCLALDPDLSNLMRESSDYCTLQWAWEGWRNATGSKMRGYYGTNVYLNNEAAQLNGFKNARDLWTFSFWNDDHSFFSQIEHVLRQLKPFYEQLHAYVRRQLIKKYGADKFPSTGHIPAHLLGNMWAQDWSGLYSLVLPYPHAASVDLTSLLRKKKTTEMNMVHQADDFFQSLGMDPMTDAFWRKSVFTKPKDVNMVCHASAWDFFTREDFRIKMCTQVRAGDFQTIHHEMGHIQYYMHYKDQPVEFRQGANPGFHEAIGDLIGLSAMSVTHLKAVGLLPEHFSEQREAVINAQMKIALEKIAFMPFGYLVDKYRWMIFDKTIPLSRLNSEWWKIRCSFQGVSPPVHRTEDDFDAGAKFHVADDDPYIGYFYALVAQFQFHEAMCRKIGWTKDFHKCDIYKQPKAAAVLRKALALGASKPYPEVLKLLTGRSMLDAEPILSYFAPLYDWLREQNKDHDVTWDNECPTIIPDANCNYNRLRFPPTSILSEVNTDEND